MKFGKEFRTHLEETLPEWRDKFLCYKPLKKLLKNLPQTAVDRPVFGEGGGDNPAPPPPPPPANHNGENRNPPDHRPLVDLQAWFVGILNEELEKFNDFYVDKEEEFVIRFQVILALPFSLV